MVEKKKTSKTKNMKKKLTQISFKLFSKRNPTKFNHEIFKEGHLSRDESVLLQQEYIRARNTSGELKRTDVTITYYTED